MVGVYVLASLAAGGGLTIRTEGTLMAGGLAALLDDITAIAKSAAASIDDVSMAAGRASTKAAGVVVDDAAVTPRYLEGSDPARELPVVKQIAIGSLRNKLLIILPIVMLLSEFADWVLTPLLMLGGTYLCFEGAEKLWEKFSRQEPAEAKSVAEWGPDHEKTTVAGAIRIDLILSAEIMVLALDEVASEPFVPRLIVMLVVAFVVTVVVYGSVALIVKMDDIGLHLVKTRTGGMQSVGRKLVEAMPKVLALLSLVGMVAMLWVGGHILLLGVDELGWHWPYGVVHDLQVWVEDTSPVLDGVLGWLANTAGSALVGVVWGGVIVAVVHQFHHRRGHQPAH